MRLLLAAMLTICASSSSLSACINDSSTMVDEQQFVSGYNDRDKLRARSPVGVKISTFNPTALLLLVPGLALAGVAFLWLRQERALAEKRLASQRSKRI